MKRTQRISWKLSRVVIGLFIALFLVYSVITSFILYQKSVADAEEFSVGNAELYASKINKRFSEVQETLESSKRMYESLQSSGSLTAESILKMTEENLTSSGDLFGMSVIIEENLLTIDESADKNLFDSENRFIPYLFKNGGAITTEKVTGYEEGNGDWYQIPLKEKRAIMTEPYDYDTSTGIIRMTTLSLPLITDDGRFMGVVTADFSLDFLNELVKTAKIAGGYTSIITDSGQLLTNSINEKLTGSNMEDAIDWAPIKSILDENKTHSLYVDSKQLSEQAFNSFAPISLEGINEVWSFQTVTPNSTILKTFTEILLITIIASIIIIILMAGVSAWFIGKQLKPLDHLRHSIKAASEGDLTKQIDQKLYRKDEIGLVADAFNEMLAATSDAMNTVKVSSHSIKETAQMIHQTFEEVSAASEEVAAAVDEIAQGSAQQSSDTECTNEQMVVLAEQINGLAGITEKINGLSTETRKATINGIEQVAVLSEHNLSTNEMNRLVQEQIQTLSHKIAAIDTVIDSIHGITAQTNLLALNASIEAARAGEHGKGFAVVAEEVRKLAEQSRKETDIIQKTVQEIMEESQQTVSVITKNMELIEGKNQAVSDTEVAFKQNAELAEQLSNSIQDINVKLQAMLTYKDQAIESIQSVSAISEETAASAEEVSASAAQQQKEMERVALSTEEMNSISSELEKIVNRFKVS